MSSSQHTINTVFFDLGNVLVHLHLERFFLSFSKLVGITHEQSIKIAEQHAPFVDKFNRGLIDPLPFYQQITHGLDQITFEQFNKVYTDIFSLNNFMLETAKSLKSLVNISILSNTDILHFSYIQEKFGFIPEFKNPITSFDAHSLKPEKEIYNFALENLETQANNSLFIDDNIDNIITARSLGMYGIHYTGNNPEFIKQMKELGFSDLDKLLEV